VSRSFRRQYDAHIKDEGISVFLAPLLPEGSFMCSPLFSTRAANGKNKDKTELKIKTAGFT
jgi:hypothetical protein